MDKGNSRPERIGVLGAPVDAVDMAGALSLVDEHVKTGERPGCIVAMNPEKVCLLRRNVCLTDFWKSAFLILPDGIGIVLAARILTGKSLAHVCGADLMQNLCAAAPERGYKLFVYGARDEVNRRAVEILTGRHPGIRLVGRAHGYTPAGEEDKLIEYINASGADILFVGLGSPRQEEWMHRRKPDLKVRICMGIGGTLDTIAGVTRRAPRWCRSAGLEWLFRLLAQPTRWKRQTALLEFVARVMAAKMRGQGN